MQKSKDSYRVRAAETICTTYESLITDQLERDPEAEIHHAHVAPIFQLEHEWSVMIDTLKGDKLFVSPSPRRSRPTPTVAGTRLTHGSLSGATPHSRLKRSGEPV